MFQDLYVKDYKAQYYLHIKVPEAKRRDILILNSFNQNDIESVQIILNPSTTHETYEYRKKV